MQPTSPRLPRAILARMIAVNGLILILTSIFIGTYILAFFGISLPVVQVGGGLVVISTGWTLLRQPIDDDSGDGAASKECHEADYARHVGYCYINPLKHGLVTRVRDWPHSSFHRDVRAGLFPQDWAGDIAGGDDEFGERQ